MVAGRGEGGAHGLGVDPQAPERGRRDRARQEDEGAVKVYLLFQKKWARVYPTDTEHAVHVVTSRTGPTDASTAQRARAGVIAVLRDMARRGS